MIMFYITNNSLTYWRLLFVFNHFQNPCSQNPAETAGVRGNLVLKTKFMCEWLSLGIKAVVL